MKCLFIGGPKAGCVIDVDDRALKVMIPRLEPFSATPCAESNSVSQGFICDHVYFRQSMTDNTGREHFIFVEPDCDPLLALMNFYAEAKHS